MTFAVLAALMAGFRHGYGDPVTGDYSPRHHELRRQWQPIVEAGEALCCATRCVEKSRKIDPGSEWDLGHTQDRTGWIGPCHVKCNRVEGSRRGNAARHGYALGPEPWRPTQRW